MGNEAIARGAIEAGVKVVTTYPGTPSSEIADNLSHVAKDAGDFGIIRLIVNKPESSIKALEGLAKSINQVVVIPIAEQTSLSKIANLLGDKKVNIDYAYTSAIPINGNLALILRVSDTEKTEKILMENDIKVLTQKDFG